MRYEIQIGEITHCQTHRMTAVLGDTPDTKCQPDGKMAFTLQPDIIDVMFIRTPADPIWRIDSVDVGGPYVSISMHGVRKVHNGRRVSYVFDGGRHMPAWLSLVLDEMIPELPA